MRIVGLGGGIGAARLWCALAAAVPAEDLTLVVNTADDLWHNGLRICPDLDTTLYALSGQQDTARGWGVRDESWRAMDTLRGLGQDVWFNLGDRDLAVHLLRTGLLREGTGLTEVTARLATAMGVGIRVLPMTEHEVSTRVTVAGGADLHYQEFLVRHGASVPVHAVRRAGADTAQPAPGVLDALAAADLIVLGPSSPVASIDPILGVPGIGAAIRDGRADVVAVTPIVSTVPLTNLGELRRAQARAALLAADGSPATATAVATRYRALGARFVLDATDAAELGPITAAGVSVAIAGTLLHQGDPAEPLLAAVLGSSPTTAAPHDAVPATP
ncbi:2-phospho-L-lactate transferase [Actinokineospora sp.]|uniref:2-phospho-L-lactate transferase n=1 Tax=Actinokineospora sp. TaxID=1872133 RepID=UPI0040381682